MVLNIIRETAIIVNRTAPLWNRLLTIRRVRHRRRKNRVIMGLAVNIFTISARFNYPMVTYLYQSEDLCSRGIIVLSVSPVIGKDLFRNLKTE